MDLGEERYAVGKVPGERSLFCTVAFGDLVEVDVVELGKGCAGASPVGVCTPSDVKVP